MTEVGPGRGSVHLEAALERALDETRLVAVVAAHANSRSPTSWRAASWLLARRYPERWGDARSTRTVDVGPVVDDTFRELDELAERRMRRDPWRRR
jgi:hypothetical protein